MPRPTSPFPKLCTDATGRCFCKVRGTFVTLGRTGDPEVQRKYAALLVNLAASPVANPSPVPSSTGVTVAELLLKFATEVLPKYKTSDGRPSAEQDCFKGVMKIVRGLFAGLPAAEFGPLKLRIVREKMVAAGWSRKFINKQIGRLRLMFRWAVSWELIPVVVADALKMVKALEPGETAAPETTPRRSVPLADLEAVRAVVSEFHRDVIDLLLLTGARPGELLGLRTGDIDRTGEVWRADLSRHKTAHRGKLRTLFFNRTAQVILLRYLKTDPAHRLFQIRRDSFGNAIRRACVTAGVTRFTPHALRHTVATRLADELGTEAAQRLLGHTTRAMTEHYSRAAERQAVEAAKSLG